MFAVSILAVGILFLTGCGTTGAYQEGSLRWRGPMGQFPWSSQTQSQSPVSAVGMSTFPPDPVRRSSTFISSLTGDYTYSHSQGTDNSASRSFDPYAGPREDWRQSTYNNTYESYHPRPMWSSLVFNAPLVIPSVVPPAPVFAPTGAPPTTQKIAPRECDIGPIQMRPIVPKK